MTPVQCEVRLICFLKYVNIKGIGGVGADNDIKMEELYKDMKLAEIKLSQVAFIGISNWDIDASKLNRTLYLARPDVTAEDLYPTGCRIIRYQYREVKDRTSFNDKNIEKWSKLISDSYIQFREVEKVETRFT